MKNGAVQIALFAEGFADGKGGFLQLQRKANGPRAFAQSRLSVGLGTGWILSTISSLSILSSFYRLFATRFLIKEILVTSLLNFRSEHGI